tara:strand:- start:48 stop:206 length:159 start_codon:yes stop_codon:yes gene_type:complete
MLIKPKNPDISAEEALGIAMQKLNEQAQYIDKLEKEIERLKTNSQLSNIKDE